MSSLCVCFFFLPNPHRVAGYLLSLSTKGGEVKLWDMYQERCLATFEVGSAVQSIAWSPDGAWFVAGTATGGLQVS